MTSRLDKFREKINGEVRKRLYDEQKDQMVANITQPTKDLVEIELKVKQICQGEPLPLIYYYIIFAKEIYSKKNKYIGQSLINELMILDQKWESRGLNPIILENIKNFYVYGYNYVTPFRLDISLLNGPHILS